MGQQNYYVASSAKVLSSAFCQNALLANRQNAVKNLTGDHHNHHHYYRPPNLQIFRFHSEHSSLPKFSSHLKTPKQ